MKITAYEFNHVHPHLRLPKKVLDALGWKDGDMCELDIPTTHNSLLIFKKGKEDV